MKALGIVLILVAAVPSAAAQSVTPHHACPAGDWENIDEPLKKATRVVLAKGQAKRDDRVVHAKQTFEVLSNLKGDGTKTITLAKPDKCGHRARGAATVIIIAFKDGDYLLRGWGSEPLWKKLIVPEPANKDAAEHAIARVVASRWPTYRRIRVQYPARVGEKFTAGKARVTFVKKSNRGLAICSARRYGNINIVKGNVRTEEKRLGFSEFIEVQLITDRGIERLESGRRSKVPRRRSPRCD